MDKRKALGRGLAALIPPATGGAPISSISSIRREFFNCAIEDVHPWKDNPRHNFAEQALGELTESIRVQGLVQPLVVRQRSEAEGGGFTLIAGERRWRAAQRAGLKNVPIVVKECSDKEAFELGLVENLQREDLNPIEEAEAYHRLQSEFGYTQEQLAERVGKDRATVSNALRLLKLPDSVRGRVVAGELSMGQARALLGLEDQKAIERAAAKVVAKQLSVRQTEDLVRRERGDGKGGATKSAKTGAQASAAVRDLEQRLERALGTKVRLAQADNKSGQILIDYHSLDQLDSLLEKLL